MGTLLAESVKSTAHLNQSDCNGKNCQHLRAATDSFTDTLGYYQPEDSNVAAFSTRGRWPQSQSGAPVLLTYSYNNLLNGGLRDENHNVIAPEFIRQSVEEALAIWASVAPLHFVEVLDEGGPVVLGDYPDGQFGQLRFSHVYMNGPDPAACGVPGADPVDCGAKAKAQAYFPIGTGNQRGDVFFDNGDLWREIGALHQPDILGAAVHEIGHAIGLTHSNILGANMYWVFNRSTGLGTAALHADDIAGVQFIYGAGTGSVTNLANAVPEPMTAVLALMVSFTLLLRQPH